MRSLVILLFALVGASGTCQEVRVPPLSRILAEAYEIKEVTPHYAVLSQELVQATTLQDSFDLYMDLGEEAMQFDEDRKKVSFANYLHADALAQRSGNLQNRCATTLALAEITRRLDRYDEYHGHCREAIRLGRLLRQTDSIWLAKAYLEQGIYHYKNAQYSEQISFAKQALDIAAGNYPSDECLIRYYLGYGHYLLGDYELALEAYLKTYDLAEAGHCDRKAMHLSLAEVYLADGSYDRAVTHLMEARRHARPDDQDYDHAEVLRFLAEAQWLMGNYELALSHADSSIMINQGRYQKNYGYANLFASRACLDLGRYDDALDYIRRGHEMVLTEIQPNKVLLCQTHKQMARVYHAKRESEQALLHLDSSLSITEAAGFLKVTSDTRLAYAKILEDEGDSSGALAQYRQHMALNDSLLNATTSRQLANMKIKFDTDKKDLENASLLRQNELISARNTRFVIGGVILAGLLCTLAVFFVRLRRTKQLMSAQNETISQQNNELAEMDRIKTNFFSNITHEFRTPLTLIIEPVRQLLKTDLDERSRQSMRLIRSNANQLLGLVNQLLDMAKLEGGKMRVNLRRAEVREILAPIIDSFRPMALKKGLQLSVDIEDPIPPFYMDVPKVKKITYNLMSNAIKYTQQGQIFVKIRLGKVEGGGHLRPGDSLMIEIKDTGVGIRESESTKIFDRFYQIDGSSTRAGAGTGIGLSLTRELAELMGGGISVISTVGVGSTFTFSVPMRFTMDVDHEEILQEEDYMDNGWTEERDGLNHVSAGQLISQGDPLANGSSETSKPLVLIVEDNQELRSFIKEALTDDYMIVEAEDGLEGLATAREQIPDLIISDIMMPQMDGVEMSHKVRNDQLTSHIPIILLTAKSTINSKIEGWTSGVDAYLTKPFHTEELQVRIAKLIESRRLLQAKYIDGMAIEEVNGLPGQSELDQEFLNKLVNRLSQRIDDSNLSVEVVAQEMFLSRSQLFRKVKGLTGMSPNEFIRNYRLDRAKKLLGNRNVSVLQVSEAVGFGDEKYFSTRFKERFGMSPSEV